MGNTFFQLTGLLPKTAHRPCIVHSAPCLWPSGYRSQVAETVTETRRFLGGCWSSELRSNAKYGFLPPDSSIRSVVFHSFQSYSQSHVVKKYANTQVKFLEQPICILNLALKVLSKTSAACNTCIYFMLIHFLHYSLGAIPFPGRNS